MAKLELKASEAIEEVRKLRAGIKSLKEEAKNSDGADALVDRLDKMQKMAELSIHKFKALDAAISKSKDEAKKAVGPYDKLIKKFREADAAAKNAAIEYGRYSKAASEARKKSAVLAAQLKKVDDASKPLKFRFAGVNKVLGSLAGFAGFYVISQQVIALAKSTFELTKRLNAFNFAMEAVLKDEQELITTRTFLREITEAYGAELISTTNRYIKFRTAAKEAGMSMADTQKIFATMTKAAGVLGLQTDELTGIYLALEQMISKGKITTEELRRQLGERLPGAMDIMAKSIGVSTAELDKMMKKGEVISKDVLPRFAEEVERAFGLESVTKVETLAAAEIRLGNAWTNLINTIESGQGRISKLLMNFFSDLTDILDYLEILSRDDKSWIDVEQAESYADALNYMAEKLEKVNKVDNDKIEALNKSIIENNKLINNEKISLIDRNKLLDENKQKLTEIKAIRDSMAKATDFAIKDLSNYGLELQKVNKEIQEREDKLTLLNRLDLENNKLTKEQLAIYIKLKNETGKRNASYKDVVDFNKELLLSSKRDLGYWKGKINAAKSFFKVIDKNEGSEGSGNDVILKSLRNVLDLEKQIQINRLKANIETNEAIIENEETSNEKRNELLKENANKLIEIAKLEEDLAVASINSKSDKEIEALKKSFADGKVLQEDYTKQLADLEKERGQKILIEKQKYDAKIVDSQDKLISDITRVNIEYNEDQIKLSSAAIDAKIALLNEELLAEETTAKRKKEIIKDIKKLQVESANEQIKTAIMIAEAQLLIAEAMGRNTEELRHQIDILKGSLLSIDTDDIEDKFSKIADYIKEFAEAIGNLGVALYDRNIEFIEAEMDATEKKYKREIELAEGNEQTIKNLEQEREKRLQLLEAKRLKEEQRKAKFEKAKALVDIAINTAVAVSSKLAQPWMVPVIIALGALQTATVLAQPIPQYKDGLEEADKDHIGMINDGKNKEYIKRGNKILSTDKKNAIVTLKKGDTVYPSYEAMTKDMLAINLLTNGSEINENELYILGRVMEDSIDKGFKKAKINNNIKLINNQRDNGYRDSLSRWS